MLQRLDLGPDGNKDPAQVRRELDTELKVSRWRLTDGQSDPYEDAERDPAAPWWWDGEEEASDAFLAAQGVSL